MLTQYLKEFLIISEKRVKNKDVSFPIGYAGHHFWQLYAFL